MLRLWIFSGPSCPCNIVRLDIPPDSSLTLAASWYIRKIYLIFLWYVYHIVLQAKAFQSLYVKEISHGKDIEDAVGRVKEELERMKSEREELNKKLHVVREENLALESQLAKSQEEIGEWEEKTVSAVKLLISFREKRDRLRLEHENAVREVEWIRRLMKGEASSFSRSEFPVFSFLEINEATNDFDPSWKIAEGRYGTVYRGILRQMHVAIKMLPSYGSKSQLDFQREVNLTY